MLLFIFSFSTHAHHEKASHWLHHHLWINVLSVVFCISVFLRNKMNLTIVLLLLTLVLYLCLSCVYSYLPSPAQCGRGRWRIPGYPAQINASRRRGTVKPDPSYNEENMILIYFGHKRCQRSSLIYFVLPRYVAIGFFPDSRWIYKSASPVRQLWDNCQFVFLFNMCFPPSWSCHCTKYKSISTPWSIEAPNQNQNSE